MKNNKKKHNNNTNNKMQKKGEGEEEEEAEEETNEEENKCTCQTRNCPLDNNATKLRRKISRKRNTVTMTRSEMQQQKQHNTFDLPIAMRRAPEPRTKEQLVHLDHSIILQKRKQNVRPMYN